MKFKVFFTIIVVFFSYEVFCSTGVIVLRDQSNVVSLGDEVDFTIIISSVSSSDEFKIAEAFNKKNVIDGIYISKLDKIQRNSNNYDVLELYLRGVFLERRDIYSLVLNDIALPFTPQDFQIEETEPTEKPILFNVVYNRAQIYEWGIGILALLSALLVLVIFLKRHYERKKAERKKEAKKKSIIKMVSQIENRRELEELCTNLDEYKKYVKFQNSSVELLRSYINSIQYKRDWTQEELHKGLDYLDRMRREMS